MDLLIPYLAHIFLPVSFEIIYKYSSPQIAMSEASNIFCCKSYLFLHIFDPLSIRCLPAIFFENAFNS